MNIKLNARMIALTLALILVALLLVVVVALNAVHSVTWHILALSPNIFNHGH
jgi:hypothetical protein